MRTRADVFWIKFLQPLLGDAGKQFIFFDGQRDSQSVSAESVEVVLNMSFFQGVPQDIQGDADGLSKKFGDDFMTATIILGLIIAAAFGYGLKKIYRAFFKSEAACCSEGGCSGCEGSCSAKKAIDDGYRARVEKIERFPIHRTIDVDGMTCEKCIYKVVRALEKVDGVTLAAASLEKQSAQVGLKADVPDDTLREAIRKAGYGAGAVTA